MAERDYSATPLWKKLGIKEGSRLCQVNPPDGFRLELPAGATSSSRLAGTLDVILLFATKEAELKKTFARAKKHLEPAGGLWVAYPKKASSIATNLTFENVQAIGLAAKLVDNKSCAIDENWSGLRFVYRVKDR